MIISQDGTVQSNDRKLELFHNTKNNPKRVICITDNPTMIGFGRQLAAGDIVEISGTVHQYFGFAVAVPSECAFYEYSAFEPTDEFFNGGK